MAQKNFQDLPPEMTAAIMSFTDWFSLLNFRVLNKHTKDIFNSDFFLLIVQLLWPKFFNSKKIVRSDFWREKLVRMPGIPANSSASLFSFYMELITPLFIEDLLNGNSNHYVYFWIKMKPTESINTQDLKKIWATCGYDSNLFQRLENTLTKKLATHTDELFKESDLQETDDYIYCLTEMDIAISLPLLLGLPEIAEKNAEYLKKHGRLEDLDVRVIHHDALIRDGEETCRNYFVLFTPSELVEKLGTEKLRKILISQE